MCRRIILVRNLHRTALHCGSWKVLRKLFITILATGDFQLTPCLRTIRTALRTVLRKPRSLDCARWSLSKKNVLKYFVRSLPVCRSLKQSLRRSLKISQVLSPGWVLKKCQGPYFLKKKCKGRAQGYE